MAQTIIYANGETSGSSFHLVSEWKWDSSAAKPSYGPTTGSATYTYTIGG